jgi:hypothetical protein
VQVALSSKSKLSNNISIRLERALLVVLTPWFKPVVESYNTFRGHLAHGFDPDPQTREFGEELNAYSRISAAIYILMAKQMGFAGKLERSQLEGEELVDLGNAAVPVDEELRSS